eukprot:765551-Hanusia_phi.AAC.1
MFPIFQAGSRSQLRQMNFSMCKSHTLNRITVWPVSKEWLECITAPIGEGYLQFSMLMTLSLKVRLASRLENASRLADTETFTTAPDQSKNLANVVCNVHKRMRRGQEQSGLRLLHTAKAHRLLLYATSAQCPKDVRHSQGPS